MALKRHDMNGQTYPILNDHPDKSLVVGIDDHTQILLATALAVPAAVDPDDHGEILRLRRSVYGKEKAIFKTCELEGCRTTSVSTAALYVPICGRHKLTAGFLSCMDTAPVACPLAVSCPGSKLGFSAAAIDSGPRAVLQNASYDHFSNWRILRWLEWAVFCTPAMS